MSKPETVAEFLARGGKVHRAEYTPPPEDSTMLKHKPQFTTDLLSLGEAEFYFGEHRRKNVNPKQMAKFKKALDEAALPEHLVAIIDFKEEVVEPEVEADEVE